MNLNKLITRHSQIFASQLSCTVGYGITNNFNPPQWKGFEIVQLNRNPFARILAAFGYGELVGHAAQQVWHLVQF